jgi:hypothetical protein
MSTPMLMLVQRNETLWDLWDVLRRIEDREEQHEELYRGLSVLRDFWLEAEARRLL